MTTDHPADQSGTVAVIAALPRELALLSKKLRATGAPDPNGVLLQIAQPSADRRILLVTAGMGPQRAAFAFAAALSLGPVRTFLSVGLAGACDPALTPGDLVEAATVIDSSSGERFETDANLGVTDRRILVTSTKIAGPLEKQRLRATYNAAAVDMESSTIARLARAHSIPFGALKAISEAHSVDLTHLSVFSDHRGQFRTGAFVLHTALRPRLWGSTVSLGRSSKLALENLTSALYQVLAHSSR